MPPYSNLDTCSVESDYSCFDIKQDEQQHEQETTTTPQRRVGFSMYTEVLEINNVDDISEDEKAAVWFTRQEMKTIKKNLVVSLFAINDGRNEDNFHCQRGLERLMTTNVHSVRQTRYAAKEAVFGLQKLHRLKGVEVSTLMADIYGTSAMPALEAARNLAMHDAIEVIC